MSRDSRCTTCWTGTRSNRIAPAPRAIQGKLTCGISLLIEPEDIDAARACIEENKAPHYAIASLAGQIQSHRDKYC